MVLRRSSKILIGTGLVLIILAAVLRFFVVPAFSKLPDSVDVTAQYVGTGTLMNPAALQSGDYANVIASGVPVTVDRHVYVSETQGDSAVAHDDFTVSAPGGVSLPTNHTYVLDRKSMDAADPIEGVNAEPHSGMTIGLPLSPDASDYSLYDFATRSTVPLTYVDSSVVSGRDVLNYRAEATGPLQDPAILGALPPALPKAQLAGLAPLLPADLQAELAPALGSLPDPVPFNYTAVSKFELSADSVLGTPIDGALDQQVIANVEVGGKNISLIPVLALDTELSDQSVADAANAASSQSRLLTLISVVTPIVLALVGIVLFAVGLLRRNKQLPASPSERATVDSSTV
ncbi:porin PorA family protein [Rhodococcus opacus]|uniref:porin PorA family protein n=1 Tax=Rhodococcus opacus TaxID=37919 RepID=UPI00294910EF|nr:porin PorA family protein [Rhodococcus opacus]MDV6248113.1 porin PorA family protein [Rhodococcus opacus]